MARGLDGGESNEQSGADPANGKKSWNIEGGLPPEGDTRSGMTLGMPNLDAEGRLR